VLVSFASGALRASQRRNRATGLGIGGFDAAACYGPGDIDRDFRRRNHAVLAQPRGFGYWLWKPYFIRRALAAAADSDVIFYCDAGARFVAPVRPLVDLLLEGGGDVLAFDLDHQESHWTKRDAFVLMDCDRENIAFSPQRLASFSLWRNSPGARALADAYLDYAQDERILTDLPNTAGLPDYPGFRDHRHDQSIFSLLTKRAGIAAHRDPSQWGNGARDRHSASTYGQLIEHARARDETWAGRLRSFWVDRRRNV